MKTLKEIKEMSGVEIQEYALIMKHPDGSEESELVYERLAAQIA